MNARSLSLQVRRWRTWLNTSRRKTIVFEVEWMPKQTLDLHLSMENIGGSIAQKRRVRFVTMTLDCLVCLFDVLGTRDEDRERIARNGWLDLLCGGV
jgi:hypothetical protein